MGFLKQQVQIKDFNLSVVKELPETKIIEKDEINPKCKIKKRARQYLTATFKYENFYVGLLELENYPSSASASWVIISKTFINNESFNFFIKLFLEDNTRINELIKIYKKTSPKFTKKNHERNENLEEAQLAKWFVALIGKLQ